MHYDRQLSQYSHRRIGRGEGKLVHGDLVRRLNGTLNGRILTQANKKNATVNDREISKVQLYRSNLGTKKLLRCRIPHCAVPFTLPCRSWVPGRYPTPLDTVVNGKAPVSIFLGHAPIRPLYQTTV